MDDERMINTAEKEKQYTATVIARLGDLSIGNPDGVPTKYADIENEAVQADAEKFVEHLVDPTDLTALACIDGRHCNCNADGSDAQVRLRRVGGSASNFGVARNAGADIFLDDTKVAPGDTLGHQIHVIDELVASETGFGRSAHLGGCGGANGEVGDHEVIASNPAVMNAVETIMGIPQVKEYLGVDFDADLAKLVVENAAATADFLKESNWNGQAYVDGVVEENATGVEDLQVDHEDEKFHGHRENTLVIIIGDKTLDMDDAFVWNLKATKQVAEAFSGERGKEGYVQALIADIAKHVAVANRLPSDSTPVVLISEE